MPPTLSAQLRAAAARLSDVSDSPRRDAELLLAHALGIEPRALLARLDTTCEVPALDALLERRLAYEPVPYILGEWEFFSLPIRVRAPMLVPRPETELLVERALEHIPFDAPARVLDLCTGTGCVGLALAHMRPRAQVDAVDVRPEAVALARENAAALGLRVAVLEGDLFGALPAGSAPYALIVANPPYVAEGDWDTLSPTITRHEDPGALLSGADGLDCSRRIVSAAPAWLRPGGYLALETDPAIAQPLAEMLSCRGFGQVAVWRDLAGLARVAGGIWPG